MNKSEIKLLTCNHPYTGELITEEFRPITDYEGKYEISSFGRVKSLNFGMTGKPGLLSLHTYNGYPTVTLSNKIIKSFQVHQLVAIAFLNHKRCGYKSIVNHKGSQHSNTRRVVQNDFPARYLYKSLGLSERTFERLKASAQRYRYISVKPQVRIVGKASEYEALKKNLHGVPLFKRGKHTVVPDISKIRVLI